MNEKRSGFAPLLLVLVLLPTLSWAYTPYYTSNLQTNSGTWSFNPSSAAVSFVNGVGLRITSGGSIISTQAIPAYAPSVEAGAVVQTNGTNCSGCVGSA